VYIGIMLGAHPILHISRIKVKKACKKTKKEHLQEQLEEIEQLNRENERGKCYKAISG
jgi:hypothetical protein